MHFKKFFYKDYFTSIELTKPLDKNEFSGIKKDNSSLFNIANKILTNKELHIDDYQLLKHSSYANTSFQNINVTTTYPGLIIGTGYTHETNNEKEFKLGFYFDHTTGLPCIPGSSIKGVLRSMFPQFNEKHPLKPILFVNQIQVAKVEFISKAMGWQNEIDKPLLVHQLEQVIFEGVDLANTKTKSDEGKDEIVFNSTYKRFCFYNGYISSSRDNKIFEIDTLTPHGNDQISNPIPLNFLKIKPNVTFTLQISMHLIEGLVSNIEKLLSLFALIINTNGIGAKTNVGYGRFDSLIEY